MDSKYYILHPDITWSEIAHIYGSCGVLGQTPESNGYIRVNTQIEVPESEFVIPCEAQSEFVTDAEGTLLGGFA